MMSNVNIFIWFISDRTFEPPLTWSAMDDKVNLKMVQLSTTDQEYKDVTTKFKATAGGVNVEFVKVIIHDFLIFPLIFFPYM